MIPKQPNIISISFYITRKNKRLTGDLIMKKKNASEVRMYKQQKLPVKAINNPD